MGIDTTNLMNSHSASDNTTTQQSNASDSAKYPSFGNNTSSTTENTQNQNVVTDKRSEIYQSSNKDGITSYLSTPQETDKNKQVTDIYVCF